MGQDFIPIELNKNENRNVAARALAYARGIKGMSQKELAALSNIDQSDISKIERGVANPSIATLQRLSDALGGELKVEISFGKDNK